MDGVQMRRSGRGMAVLSTVLAVAFAQGVLAHDDRPLGPWDYVRGKGEPRERVTRFTVHEPEADYLMSIRTHGPGNGTLNSATIRLNGESLLRSGSFKGNAREIEIPVELAADNELVVTLRGAPGGKLEIEIVREDSTGRGELRRIRELYLPEAWAGHWHFDVEYFSAVTGEMVASEPAEATFCPRDRVGLSSIVPRHPGAEPTATSCSGDVTGDRLRLSCTSLTTLAACTWQGRFELDLARRAGAMDTIDGSATFDVTATTPGCAAFVGGLPVVASVSGLLSSAPGDCTAPPGSLLEKLVSEPELLTLIPPPIGDLTARTDGRHVRLSWSAVEEAVRYRIYRAIGNAPYRLIAVRPAGSHAGFRDRRVRGHDPYRYVVSWLDAEGRVSPVSNEAHATTETTSTEVLP